MTLGNVCNVGRPTILTYSRQEQATGIERPDKYQPGWIDLIESIQIATTMVETKQQTLQAEESDYSADEGVQVRQVAKKQVWTGKADERMSFRPYQQQDKYENALKQEKRDAGLQSKRSRSSS